MLPIADKGAITGIEDIFTRTLDKEKLRAHSGHLGNVRSVITDMKLPDGNDHFLPEATTRNYYYPFGMERPLMTASTGTQSYRYGYNGMEKDNAVSPTGVPGANYSTDFREIDTRIGRWWSRDPIVKPWESPYVTFGDNPIAFADPSGLDPVASAPTNPNPGDSYTDDNGDLFRYVPNGTDRDGNKHYAWKKEVTITGQKDLHDNSTVEDYRSIRYCEIFFNQSIGYWQTLSFNREFERLSVLTYNKYGC